MRMTRVEGKEINSMSIGELLTLAAMENYTCSCQSECDCEPAHLVGLDNVTKLYPWMASEALEAIHTLLTDRFRHKRNDRILNINNRGK